jgi:hypothetical protein
MTHAMKLGDLYQQLEALLHDQDQGKPGNDTMPVVVRVEGEVPLPPPVPLVWDVVQARVYKRLGQPPEVLLYCTPHDKS